MPSLNYGSWCRLLAVLSCLGSSSVALCAPATSCCQSLSAALSSKVVFPESAAYDDSLLSYWAQGEQLITPSCVFLPQTAQDVSSALKILVSGSCKFAVRSGGHGSPTGIANIEDGVTFDLRGINFTTISSDNSLVSVGPGQVLGNVFSLLYQRGLYIPAARAAGIGAGGSTLGGGLGYLYPKLGFAADSVVEFEVVLANGSIVSATKSVNSDLWLALRGGGSNFGIVTKLVYTTYPQGDVWGGDVVYPTSSLDANLQAFYNFAANPNYDENAAVMMNYHWSPTDGNILDNQLVYGKPVVAPPAFSGFYAIPDQLANTTILTTIPALSEAQAARSPDGFQEITFAVSYRNNVQILKDVFTLFNNTIPKLSNIAGVSFSLSFEALIQSMGAKSKAKGGDVLGVNPPAEGVVLTLLSLTFSNAADYASMDKVAETLLSDITSAAKKRGLSYPYIDMNHAKGSQKVLQSYGSANYAFLKTTAKKYDPSAVFQKLMPGGFKL